jgi:hypothetical protein
VTRVEWVVLGAAVVAVVAAGMAGIALWRTRSDIPKRSAETGLLVWYRTSLGAAVVAGIALFVLVGTGMAKEWVAQRFSGVMAPLGVVVAAAIASAGAARLAIAQSQTTEKARLEDAEKELWNRFDSAARQLADKTHFAIRVAGVYSFVGLADDWLRHHRRRTDADNPASNSSAECETIVDTLCAYLRQNTHKAKKVKTQNAEKVVNEAIITQLRLHMGTNNATPDDPIEKPAVQGLWADRGLVLDLHEADLSRSLMYNVDFRKAVLTDVDLYDADLSGARLDGAKLQRADLCKADLSGATLTGADFEDAIYDDDTKWPSDFSPPASTKKLPAGGAHRVKFGVASVDVVDRGAAAQSTP